MKKTFLIIFILTLAAPCCIPPQYIIEDPNNVELKKDIADMQEMLLYLHKRISALEYLHKLEWQQQQQKLERQKDKQIERKKRMTEGNL